MNGTLLLEQYEIVWVFLFQHQLPGRPDGFALEIRDFLGPGNPDRRGQRTVWVRGLVVDSVAIPGGIRLVRASWWPSRSPTTSRELAGPEAI
jgi:hypothetical protein